MVRCPVCSNALDTRYQCSSCGFATTKRNGIDLFAPEYSEESSHFPVGTHDRLFEVEQNHFWFTHRNEIISSLLNKHFPGAQSFCEVGCGTGGVIYELSKRNPEMAFTALELYVQALTHVKRRMPNVRMAQVDIHSLPFEEEFDVVGVFDVLEHLDDDGHALEMVARAIRPGGGVIITVPQHEWLWSSVDEYSCHRRRYHKQGLVDIVEKAGLEVVEDLSLFSLLLPAMYISRFTAPQVDEEFDPAREMNIGKLTNMVLRSICRVEFCLQKVSLRFPFGGSLALVAKKH